MILSMTSKRVSSRVLTALQDAQFSLATGGQSTPKAAQSSRISLGSPGSRSLTTSSKPTPPLAAASISIPPLCPPARPRRKTAMPKEPPNTLLSPRAEKQASPRVRKRTPKPDVDETQQLPGILSATNEDAPKPSDASASKPRATKSSQKPLRSTVAYEIEALLKSNKLPVYDYKDPEWGANTPAVVYTRNEEEADELVGALSGPLGFDLEWPVVFRKGAAPLGRRTALVQVADASVILMIQVSAMSQFPEQLKKLIEDPKVVKVGANIKNDAEKLRRDFGILARGLVELGTMAQEADPWMPDTSASSENATAVSPSPISKDGLSTSTSDTAASASTPGANESRPSWAPKHGFPYSRPIVSLAKMVALYTGRHLMKDDVRTSNWEAKLSKAQCEYAANDAHCAVVLYNRLMKLAKLVPGRESKIERGRIDMLAENQSRAQSQPATPDIILNPSLDISPPDHQTVSNVVIVDSANTLTPIVTATAVETSTINQRHMEAYNLWHTCGYTVEKICTQMRASSPLKTSTVISYVVKAIKADPSLPYDRSRLRMLIQSEVGSWRFHRSWFELLGREAHAAASAP